MQVAGSEQFPASLSAVFDSSDDDDLVASAAEPRTVHHDIGDVPTTATDGMQPQPDSLLTSELLRLAEEYRQAGWQAMKEKPCLA